MTQRAGGFRAKTRRTLAKTPRNRGKFSTTRFLQELKIGESVAIYQEPSVHKAMPHPRYKGRVGTIIGTQGRAYKVEVWDGGVRKIFLSAPIHLKKA